MIIELTNETNWNTAANPDEKRVQIYGTDSYSWTHLELLEELKPDKVGFDEVESRRIVNKRRCLLYVFARRREYFPTFTVRIMSYTKRGTGYLNDTYCYVLFS